MFHLVTGGSGSGKSAYAESVLCSQQKGDKELLYIATMIPFGAETEQKIKRHREMRKNKGFSTVEWYSNLQQKLEQDFRFAKEGRAKPNVLLECMSNLVANEIYEPGKDKENAAERIVQAVRLLKERCANLVVVTNEVCSAGSEGSAEMDFYRKVLSEVNCHMAEMADQVTEVVYGFAMQVKALDGMEQTITQSNAEGREDGKQLKLIIGGCHQGKQAFATKQYGQIAWQDGRFCEWEAIYHCQGIHHFECYIRRLLEQKKESKNAVDMKNLVRLLEEKNPTLLVLSQEIGYGIVPADPFEREWRECTGRICTELAAAASHVYRVTCGIGVRLKGENQ